ncbi:hypothetical protein DICPUDRAFT_43101 [Dictyostelium purpureum]|uniref:Uncharacterized protein n=1 Tax=Dictyostelium purpureum TaxID=5786 RepID=F1A3H5_DICPU|nr:uncharacterized protein DICPUDRAFT_43101 [Dictyostelium purpureum]EGC29250.1 hypothetical protein DICPUDRAFT_43101 [Dictyostelium purpureum]|eukprot:XP_003294219.1 hypothetical protein DICPUDRAFT_43101 [Dictyostelium purpureum]
MSTVSCDRVLSNHQGSVTAVKYNSDGAYCISGSQDKTLKLWNPNKGSMIHSFEEHGYGIIDFCSSLDNKQLFSCAEKQLYQWDIANGSVVRRFQNAHNDTITCVCVNNDSSLLFTGSNDKLVKAWDLRSNSFNPVQILDDAKDSITSIITNETTQTVDLSGHEVITSSVDGSIRQYDVRMGTLTTYDDTIPISSVSITKNKKCFIASCTDETIKLIDIDTYDTLKEYKSHKNSTYKINSCSNYNDSLIIGGSEDNDFYIWELSSAKLLHKLSGHTNVITHVNAHPTKNQFITSSTDCTIRIWSTQE